ncbi:MAG: UDP-N-acetylmuramoyl-L-alanyl-D-glutamate--2,6-diaminopimelate ligase [Mycobacteriales bacterium]|nr:UDP-N-acetylmuramoyl-L-alanyl-D-glutamate--2,6-diaminopimelate ligase [Mycobacteriales bacterium]
MPVDPTGALPVRPSAPAPRALADLLARVPQLVPSRPLEGLVVTGCTHDSRAVQPGDLYAALPGSRVHGADFVDAAVAAGAVAVLTDPAGAQRCTAYDVVLLVTDDPRSVLGDVAAWVHGDPAKDLLLLGVTGTNGKTTTAFFLDAGLRAAGHTTGLLGTVETRVGDLVVPSVRTTPEAPDLQGLLAVMRERGVTAVSMEVSSHALALGRVDGVRFDTAVFTNLSQDHLDFHASMEDYEAAKAELFTPRRATRGVVNVDDRAGERIAAAGDLPVSRLGAEGEWRVVDVDLRGDGSSFRLLGPDVDQPASVRLPGAFNVTNAAGALVALAVSGVDLAAAAEGVAALPGVPGRMERVDAGQRFLAVVDYAHTPDAVTTLLRSVRAVTPGRVIVVLGCGGDRDRGKRPLMGRAAADGADVAVFTSDNPRSEDPLLVLHDMTIDLDADLEGIVVEPDRRAAIALAVAQAMPGDAVVVAGKGHESGQDVRGVVTPFDDRLVLREALASVVTR